MQGPMLGPIWHRARMFMALRGTFSEPLQRHLNNGARKAAGVQHQANWKVKLSLHAHEGRPIWAQAHGKGAN